MGWTVQGSRLSAPIQTGPGLNHPPPSGAEVKERVELYLYSPLGLNGLFLEELYLFTLHFSDFSIINFASFHHVVQGNVHIWSSNLEPTRFVYLAVVSRLTMLQDIA
jgi:hypothetical protein